MLFFPLLGLAGLAVGAAIKRAEPGNAITPVPQVTEPVSASTSGAPMLTVSLTTSCTAGDKPVSATIYTSVCTSPYSWRFDPRDCAWSPYVHWMCQATAGPRAPSHSCERKDQAGRCQGWMPKFAEATPTPTRGPVSSRSIHPSFFFGPSDVVTGVDKRDAEHSTLPGFSPTRSNAYTTTAKWSNTLPVDSVPNWTKTRSNVEVTNSPSPGMHTWGTEQHTWRTTLPYVGGPKTKTRSNVWITNSPVHEQSWIENKYTTFPACSFDKVKGRYDCHEPTKVAARGVPDAQVTGPGCSFDKVNGEYDCLTPAAGAAEAAPTCYLDAKKGAYVCAKPKTCYFDKGEYICPQAAAADDDELYALPMTSVPSASSSIASTPFPPPPPVSSQSIIHLSKPTFIGTGTVLLPEPKFTSSVVATGLPLRPPVPSESPFISTGLVPKPSVLRVSSAATSVVLVVASDFATETARMPDGGTVRLPPARETMTTVVSASGV